MSKRHFWRIDQAEDGFDVALISTSGESFRAPLRGHKEIEEFASGLERIADGLRTLSSTHRLSRRVDQALYELGWVPPIPKVKS